MRKKDLAFAILAIAFAVVCISLGVWQLQRLAERRAMNDQLRARAAMAPVSFAQLPADTAAAHYRRVRLAGTYDFANEIILTNRTRDGSPGVHIITPLRIAGTDSAVLVNRGWVYAPDGMTVELSKWREPQSMTGDAYVENFQTRKGAPNTGRHQNAYRWMDYGAISRAIPYPLAREYAVLLSKGAEGPNVPPRLDVPPLDEGPHRSYALQWFSFATIALVGMVVFVRRKHG